MGQFIRSAIRIAALTVLALPVSVQAQNDPLFLSHDTLELVVRMPMASLISDAKERPELEGRLEFSEADGRKVGIDMTMTTRGRSRLDYCHFPPLKINIKKGQATGTLFDGQNKLKIVTHCRNGSTHEKYLWQEYGIYRAYNELTDYSFRVRWLTITYKDSEGKRKDETHPAFFIESAREAAARLGRERVQQNQISSAALDPVESSKYAVFQYLIANTDWSMIKGPGDEGCCHNGKILMEPGTDTNWIVMPYDFDQSGLMSTKYSQPAPALKIRSVRQRLYRGRCRHNGELERTVELFNDKRQVMEGHLTPEVLGERVNKKTLHYIDAFYQVINDPAKRQGRILERCIGS